MLTILRGAEIPARGKDQIATPVQRWEAQAGLSEDPEDPVTNALRAMGLGTAFIF